MSTKIYNGLILRDHSLEMALQSLKAFRPRFQALMAEDVAKVFARKLAFLKDLAENFCLLDKSKTQYPYISIMEELYAAERKVLGDKQRVPSWDKTLELVLIPHGQDILAVFYAESVPGYYDALLEIGFESYAYQNSTDDIPEGVTQEEWLKREATWESILEESRTLGDLGFVYTLVNWNDIGLAVMSRESVHTAFPDGQTRRYRVALDLCEYEYSMPKGQSLYAASKAIQALARDRAELINLCPMDELKKA
jgi:hypothetical protein